MNIGGQFTTLRGALTQLALIGALTASVWARPDLSGKWSGWGGVDLSKQGAKYVGTYQDTWSGQPGKLEIVPGKNPKQPNDFEGRWWEPGRERYGVFQLHVTDRADTIQVQWQAKDKSGHARAGLDTWSREAPPPAEWVALDVKTVPYGLDSKAENLALQGLRQLAKQVVKKSVSTVGNRVAAAVSQVTTFDQPKHVWVLYGHVDRETGLIDRTVLEQMNDDEEQYWWDKKIVGFKSKQPDRERQIQRHITGLKLRNK